MEFDEREEKRSTSSRRWRRRPFLLTVLPCRRPRLKIRHRLRRRRRLPQRRRPRLQTIGFASEARSRLGVPASASASAAAPPPDPPSSTGTSPSQPPLTVGVLMRLGTVPNGCLFQLSSHPWRKIRSKRVASRRSIKASLVVH